MISNNLLNEFNGKKLMEARKIRNYTLEELEEKTGISHQAISKYEKNKSNPNIDMIRLLAGILNFEVSFFYTKDIETIIDDKAFVYRSKASVAKKYKDQTELQIGLIDMVIKAVRKKVNMPVFDLSLTKAVDSESFAPTSEEEIEKLANKIRSQFSLTDGPISNITAMCEKLGVHIVYLNLNHQGIDACSVVLDGTPYVILNSEIKSAVRMRFNIAHELGHIILHLKYSKKVHGKRENAKRMEYEANYLASCLLLPESGLAKDLSSLGLDYLLILKKHWLVSVQMIIYRAEKLELFTPEYCLYLRQQISRKGWRTFEPFDDEIPKETPKMLKQAIKYLDEKLGVSISEISFMTGVKEDEILQFCSPETLSSRPLKSANKIVRIK